MKTVGDIKFALRTNWQSNLLYSSSSSADSRLEERRVLRYFDDRDSSSRIGLRRFLLGAGLFSPRTRMPPVAISVIGIKMDARV